MQQGRESYVENQSLSAGLDGSNISKVFSSNSIGRRQQDKGKAYFSYFRYFIYDVILKVNVSVTVESIMDINEVAGVFQVSSLCFISIFV